MSSEENKDLIRRYIQAIDENQTSDWRVLDEYIAEDFIAHNPLYPGVSLDREGMKHGAEVFRIAAPGSSHEYQNPSGGGRPRRQPHCGPRRAGRGAARDPRDEQGACDRRHCDPPRAHGKIVEYWSVADVARVLQQVGPLPGPPT